MLDLHYQGKDISLCHELNPQKEVGGDCFMTKLTLGTPIKLIDFLSKLYNILLNNPNEIVILFLESYVPMIEVNKLFEQNNLTNFLLQKNPNTISLTIRDILSNKTPLIVFSDYAYGPQKLESGFYHPQNYKESKYNLAEWPGCEDRNENSRAHYNNSSVNLFLLNHFYKFSVEYPFGEPCSEINDYFKIKKRVEICKQNFFLYTNFISLDYVEKGNWGGVFRFVNEQNYQIACSLFINNCQLDNDEVINKVHGVSNNSNLYAQNEDHEYL